MILRFALACVAGSAVATFVDYLTASLGWSLVAFGVVAAGGLLYSRERGAS